MYTKFVNLFCFCVVCGIILRYLTLGGSDIGDHTTVAGSEIWQATLGVGFPLGISLKGSERQLKTHVQNCGSHDFEID